MGAMKVGFVFVLLVWAIVTPVTAGAAVVKNISTGINVSTGAQLANNASDPDWVVAPGGDGGSYVGQSTIARSSPLPSAYLSDSASTASRWIVINSGSGLEGFSVPGAHYNFQTTVDLTGFMPSSVSIANGRFAVDDGIVDIVINGTVINFPNGFSQGLDKFYSLPANVGAGAFTSGVNTVVFELINNPGSPQALRLEASITGTPLPEPAEAGMAIIAAVVIGGMRRRVKRRRAEL